PRNRLLGAAGGRPQNGLEVRRAATLGGRVLALDLDLTDVPALALRVHLDRDRGTRRKRRGQQLLRTGPVVLAAALVRLIGQHLMLANVDPVGECCPCSTAGGCLPHWPRVRTSASLIGAPVSA